MEEQRVVKVGDILVNCYGAYAHSSHEFAEVTKITPTGKLRIHFLKTTKIKLGEDDTLVKPSDQRGCGNKLLTADRTHGKGTMSELWSFYSPEERYVDHFDRGA